MAEKKFTLETGINRKGQPVIVCSSDYYNELIIELRELISGLKNKKNLSDFLGTYPAIGLLSTMPTIDEVLNSN